jgi:hypothetical protein
MKRTLIVPAAAMLLALGGCAQMQEMMHGGSEWRNLLANGVAGFNKVGDANWRMADGALVADKGVGFLVTRETYGDFEMRAEVYAEADTNSGFFVRCTEREKLTATVCYEVNIWDVRPAPEYGPAAIVDVAKVVNPMPKAGGKWNTFHVTMKGDHLVVVFNGQKTVDVRNDKLKSGVIGLQHAKGVKDDLQPIKFRKVEIRPL